MVEEEEEEENEDLEDEDNSGQQHKGTYSENMSASFPALWYPTSGVPPSPVS